MDDTSGRIGNDAADIAGRATEQTQGYAANERVEVDERTREIRHEIEKTRDDMTETIDAIQERLKPRNIMAQATDRVKSAATERVRDMADTATQTAQQAMDYTRDRTDQFVSSARENPIPWALVGVGAAWLLTNRSRRSSSRNRASESQSRTRGGTANLMGSATEAASRTKEYAAETAASVRRMARQRQNQVQRMVQDNPLLVGAGALMLGAAFGLAVPETETENEWMGDARDTVVDRARDMARDAANQVQQAAGSVVDAAQGAAGKTQP